MTFPSIQFWKWINEGETEPIGTFSTSSSGELTYIVVPLLMTGTYASDRLRMKLYYDTGLTQFFTDSAWITVNGLAAITPARLRLRFDFGNEHLQASRTYHAAIETENYVRNGETKYLAIGLNFPTVSSGSGQNTGAAFEVYHKRVTSY